MCSERPEHEQCPPFEPLSDALTICTVMYFVSWHRPPLLSLRLSVGQFSSAVFTVSLCRLPVRTHVGCLTT